MPIRAWNILGSFLVFLLHDGIPEASDFIYIVDLKASERGYKQELRVNNFVKS